MKKIVLLFLSVLLVCFGLGSDALALDKGDEHYLDVEVSCPISVKAGSPLSVGVKLLNDNCNDSISCVWRGMTALAGNSGGTFGNAGVWGPFVIGDNPGICTSIPPATCTPDVTPGSVGPFNVPVVNSVPASLANTAAMATVMILNNDGSPVDGDVCMVNVLP